MLLIALTFACMARAAVGRRLDRLMAINIIGTKMSGNYMRYLSGL